jgi:transposase
MIICRKSSVSNLHAFALGRTWARIASLIETCKLNGVDPYAYLKAMLEAIAAGHPAARIDELIPWNFDKQP